MQEARNPCSQAETVAVGCDRLPREPHGPCLGVKHGPREIEVHLLNSVSERHDRAALAGYIESWKADNMPRSRSCLAESLAESVDVHAVDAAWTSAASAAVNSGNGEDELSRKNPEAL